MQGWTQTAQGKPKASGGRKEEIVEGAGFTITCAYHSSSQYTTVGRAENSLTEMQAKEKIW